MVCVAKRPATALFCADQEPERRTHAEHQSPRPAARLQPVRDDLLLRRARQAISAEEYPDALKILDATIALLPDWAEGWNARATARYLDEDYDGSMADIAQTLKREPRHLGALMGMATILEARGKTEDALKVYQRALAIAPHWRNAEEAADRLKASLAGEEL